MKTFITILFFIGNLGIFGLMLLLLERLTSVERFTLSILIAYFHTKSFFNKQDLENKIFEIKQLIENLKK